MLMLEGMNKVPVADVELENSTYRIWMMNCAKASGRVKMDWRLMGDSAIYLQH
jgi:hypothetical protein